eukprot:10398425-Lingulodinium_polyedra.AAC.1
MSNWWKPSTTSNVAPVKTGAPNSPKPEASAGPRGRPSAAATAARASSESSSPNSEPALPS